jgi:hypothetical protein
MQYRLTLRRLVHGRNPKLCLHGLATQCLRPLPFRLGARTSAAILLVGHVLQPIDHLAIQTFLDGDVRHCRRR